MSQILFQGNNLVVTGEIGQEYSNIPLTDSEKASKQNLRRTFHLTFIVQVNGKMIIHHEQIELYQIKEFVYEPEDWNAWYALCRIFNSFGYIFSDIQLSSDNGTIRDWIKRTIQSSTPL